MAISVVPVEGKKDLQRFIRFPRSLYPPESQWVSPLDFERIRFLDERKNPFFRFAEMRLFLARDGGGRDLGRIGAILNPRHNEYQKSRVGFFGFFDAIDDREVSAALLGTVEEWVRQRGFLGVQGPFNPSSNHECGLLVSGFDQPPRVMMTYNHPYYAAHIEGAGYRGMQDLVAYEWDTAAQPERLRHALALLERRKGFTLRHANLKRLDEELARLKVVYNEGWSTNDDFVPFTDAEIDAMAKDLKHLVTPDMCQFAEVDGEVAGAMLILPDVNQALKPLRGKLFPFGWWKLLRGLKRVDAMRAVLMGTRPQYRKMGIDYAFYNAGLRVAQDHRYRRIELSWILAQNVGVLRPLEKFGAYETKRYRIYEKTFVGTSPAAP